jgi:hypothetical protein
MDLPRNTTAKRLKSGTTAYYWRPPKADTAAGFTLHAEALGADASIAFSRAAILNAHLDEWRDSRGVPKSLDRQPGFGTLEWLIERYKQSKAWDKVSARVRPDYEYYFKVFLAVPRQSGGDIGSAPLASIDARAADRIYDKLQTGPRGSRKRLPVVIISKVARAWDVVRRLYPKVVPELNPFRGVEMVHSKGSRAAATRAEAYALHRALVEAGEPHLAVAPLVCFEWLQRPENVVGGFLAWTDFKPINRPNAVRIMHHKTGALVWMPLADEDGPFFEELTAYLDRLDRIGVPVVLSRPIINPHTKKRGQPRPFTLRHAQARIRKVVRAAKLPAYLTLDACRHGGMTELGDSDLTESQEMSLSGHATPDAKRRYVKKTEAQRLAAARKRRAWVMEQSKPEIQNEADSEIQNEAAENG